MKVIKLYLFCILLGFIGLSACKSPTEMNGSSSKKLPDSYYPLQVGNEWHYYELESDSFTISVVSKKNIDGKTYFVKSLSESESSESNESLVREENGIVYKRIEGKEYLYLDFNRNIGEKWQQLPYELFSYIISKTDTVYTNIGMLVDCIRIVSESELDKSETLYAPGIGLVSSSLDFKKGYVIGGSYGLIWAVINGITIKH